jgi:hypothetical protein
MEPKEVPDDELHGLVVGLESLRESLFGLARDPRVHLSASRLLVVVIAVGMGPTIPEDGGVVLFGTSH